MDSKIYRQMGFVEDEHWWFVGRREIVSSFLDRICPEHKISILDVGCGTGGNFMLLSKFGDVTGLEPDLKSVEIAAKKRVGTVVRGWLPDEVPFEPGSFDLIVLLDVLEHLDDDLKALKALMPILKNNGYILLTVPALPMLWSNNDTVCHHRRRYVIPAVADRLNEAGLCLQYVSYFNTLLFPLIALVRLFEQKIKKGGYPDDLRPIPRLINKVLAFIFTREKHLIGRIRLPLGVSIIACGQKVAAL